MKGKRLRIEVSFVVGAASTLLLALSLNVAACSNVPFSIPFYSNLTPPVELVETEVSPEAVHSLLFQDERYPSARTCGRCHPDHFREDL